MDCRLCLFELLQMSNDSKDNQGMLMLPGYQHKCLKGKVSMRYCPHYWHRSLEYKVHTDMGHQLLCAALHLTRRKNLAHMISMQSGGDGGLAPLHNLYWMMQGHQKMKRYLDQPIHSHLDKHNVLAIQ